MREFVGFSLSRQDGQTDPPFVRNDAPIEARHVSVRCIQSDQRCMVTRPSAQRWRVLLDGGSPYGGGGRWTAPGWLGNLRAKRSAMQLELRSGGLATGSVSPFVEMGAYEALWLRPGTTFHWLAAVRQPLLWTRWTCLPNCPLTVREV